MVLLPFSSAIPLAFQEVVPVAVPLPPRLFVQDTCVTPTSSEAVPARASVETAVNKVGGAGLVIATSGLTVSGVVTGKTGALAVSIGALPPAPARAPIAGKPSC
jgi:hypothetical protein